MRRARIFLILGVWIAVLPYLGFPYSWKTVLLTLTGLGIMGLSYAMYQDDKKERGEEGGFDNFRENSDFVRTRVRTEVTEEVSVD